MTIQKYCPAMLGVLLVAMVPGLSAGAMIYVDFNGSQTATGLIGGTPATWNVVTNYGVHEFGTLKDSDDHDTKITLAITKAFDSDGNAGGVWNDQAIPWGVDAATNDVFTSGVSGAANTAEVVLSHLTSAPLYNVSVIASRLTSGNN